MESVIRMQVILCKKTNFWVDPVRMFYKMQQEMRFWIKLMKAWASFLKPILILIFFLLHLRTKTDIKITLKEGR